MATKPGKFDPDKLEKLNLSALFDQHEPNWMDSEDHLMALRQWHRQRSEEMVATYRELARLAVRNGGDSSEAQALREQIKELQAKRAEAEADIEAEAKPYQARLQTHQGTAATASPESLEANGKTGLIRVRHPNRDFFLADMFDYALKDDGATMEAPIFTLSTKPDLSIWQWTSKDGNKSIKVAPSVLGRATQHDKDVLIYVVSQLTEALNRGREDAKHRVVRFTVYDFLVTTNRGVGGDDYERLQEAFERLRGTSITTDIKTGGQRVKEGFGIIDRWKIIEKAPDDERMVAVEVTLSEWLYNAVSAFEVLTMGSPRFQCNK